MGTTGRLVWVDVAKGMAIALVVIHHSLEFLEAYGWVPGPMQRVDTALTTLRMPLFFAVSGLLAASAVRSLDLRGLWRRRMMLLLYLYAVWGVVRAVWFSVVPWPIGDLDPWMQLLISPIQPWSGLWYLYALVLYTAVAWAMRRLPRWAQLSIGAAVCLCFASGAVQLGTGYTWRSIGTYFVFFLIGLHGREALTAVAERTRWLPATLTFVAFVVVAGGVTLLPSTVRWMALLPAGLLGVLAGTRIAVLLVRMPVVGAWTAALGARTLPVYVLHVLVIAAIAPALPVGVVITPIAVILLAVISIGVSLAVYAATRRVPGVFSLPRAWRPRPSGALEQPA